jgi:hypothetical protein
MDTAVAHPTTSRVPARMALWEIVFSWLVLVAGIVGTLSIPFAAGTDWPTTFEIMKRGLLSIWTLVLPPVFICASLLLLVKSKWATPLFAAHLVLGLATSSARLGVAAMGLWWWFGWFAEALIVCFCMRLWVRGVLR